MTHHRYFVNFWQLQSTSSSVGKSKQAEDLRLKRKWGRGRTVNNNFIVKNKKIEHFLVHAHPPLHYHWNSPHFTVTPTAAFDLPITGFLASRSAIPIFSREDGSMMTSPVALWGLWDVCVHVCRCVRTSVYLCSFAAPAQGLVVFVCFFPGKMPFWPSLKWRQSHVQFLAWHIAILMILWPREETHPRDICIFITWRTLLLECQISIICLQEYQTPFISSKLFLKSCLWFAFFP